MRYRVSKTGFLERFVAQKGKGEVWEAMGCPWCPPTFKDNVFIAYERHCGNWCPLFEAYPPYSTTEKTTGKTVHRDGEVTLWCGGEPRVIILRSNEGDASQDRES